jgi:hypothetical protein
MSQSPVTWEIFQKFKNHYLILSIQKTEMKVHHHTVLPPMNDFLNYGAATYEWLSQLRCCSTIVLPPMNGFLSYGAATYEWLSQLWCCHLRMAFSTMVLPPMNGFLNYGVSNMVLPPMKGHNPSWPHFTIPGPTCPLLTPPDNNVTTMSQQHHNNPSWPHLAIPGPT